MKNLLLLFSFMGIFGPAFTQGSPDKKEFVLKGHISGNVTGYAHLAFINADGKYQHDSCLLDKGAFYFHGMITGPRLASFHCNRKSRSVDDPNFTDIFLEPGVITGTFRINHLKEGEIEGSKSHKEYVLFDKRYAALEQKWKYTFEKLQASRQDNDQQQLDKLSMESRAKYEFERDNLSYDFIKEFPSSYVSAYLLSLRRHTLSIDSFKFYFSMLSPAVQRSQDGMEIARFISNAENVAIGGVLPGFTITDMNGNPVSLHDFRGKYVLIDFWASWCIPCREEHPYLKTAYAKYRDKGFTIIGFSLDEEKYKEAWLTAIKKDGLIWTQVNDVKSWAGDVVKTYNLFGKGIPANFLIDPDGRILAKDLRGMELENRLSKLLGGNNSGANTSQAE